MKIKQTLYQKCQESLTTRLAVVQDKISDIQNGLLSETKSSAGDKHETGRAMLQLEREKAGQQLAEIQKLQETLHKIKPQSVDTKVGLGSLVMTSKLNYYIAISAGEMAIDGKTYYAISAVTPIAQRLLTRQVGDIIRFKTTEFTIECIT